MKPTYNVPEHHVIQDIVPPSERHAHIGAGYAAQVSIGRLDTQWRQWQMSQRPGRIGLSPAKQIKLPFAATYLPPLGQQKSKLVSRVRAADLYAGYWLFRFRMGVVRPFTRNSKAIIAAALALGSLLHMPKVTMFPRKYTSVKGLTISLDTRFMELTKRVAAPLVALGVLCALLVAIWQPYDPNSARHRHYSRSGSAVAANASQSSGASAAQSNGKGTPSSTPTSQSAVPASSAITTPLVIGGNIPGSGSGLNNPAGSDSSSLPGIPGVTTPVSTTVPGESVGQGDKTVVKTSPQTLTLN